MMSSGGSRAAAWGKARLGLGSASAIVIANMVGAGVFTTSGFALADLGSPGRVLLAWIVGGAIALCGALAYGGIARRIPLSGGEATYLGRAFHPLFGFMAGWVSILAGFSGPIAAAALAFGEYAGTAAGARWPVAAVACAVVVACAVLHALRPQAGHASLNGLVIAKLVGLVLFIVWAGSRIVGAPELPAAAPSAPFELGAFATTLVWVSFSYTGWNGAVYLAEEIEDPERNVARALWMPTVGVALVYGLLNAVFLWAPGVELAGRPDVAAAAAEALGGVGAARAVALLVSLALLSSVSVMVLSGSRVLARLAADGMLPARLAEGAGAPRAAIALQALLASGLVLVSDLAQLIATLGFTLSLSSAATVAAALWLRHREGREAVPIPGAPLTPLLFIGFTLFGAAFLVIRSPADAALGSALLLAGLPAYALARRRR